MSAKKTTVKSASTRTPRSTPTPKAKPKDHIRNLRGAEVRLRFPSQKIKDGDKSLQLTPRGQRGDIEKVPTKEDLDSKYYFDNLGLLYEALTADEAREIISKQSINEQTRVHPAQSMLRNALGEEYDERGIQLEVPFEQQGKVVATVDVDASNRVTINRASGAPPEAADVPGSREAEATRDAQARRKDIEGPEAGLAGIKRVVVEEVKRA